ncbi:MAG: hypothetical protein Sylvanvirus26_11 [Sylvanvirus sp.]|uniref:Uncharacterized protein n=1 Tax=Sylvanvirus sp. TaxID=2487774 RepID=A0A3G5AK85_9VIRU|nr:MAG: hypothetical protein Sylvanvirus26_11 [Sylvanvirus sp.]
MSNNSAEEETLPVSIPVLRRQNAYESTCTINEDIIDNLHNSNELNVIGRIDDIEIGDVDGIDDYQFNPNWFGWIYVLFLSDY